jgi:hypothetical protein
LNDFTAALNSFQSLQREAAQREKDEVEHLMKEKLEFSTYHRYDTGQKS